MALQCHGQTIRIRWAASSIPPKQRFLGLPQPHHQIPLPHTSLHDEILPGMAMDGVVVRFQSVQNLGCSADKIGWERYRRVREALEGGRGAGGCESLY